MSKVEEDGAIPPPPGTISQRGHRTVACSSFTSANAKKMLANLYHKHDNPQGIINMAQAVNRLMEDEVRERLNRGDALTFTSRHQYYFNPSGILELREAVASLFNRHYKPPVPLSPENMVVVNGLTAGMDVLSHTLCDPGDVVITTTPVYARVFINFTDRSQAKVVPLVGTEEENFSLDVQKLENLIQNLKSEGQHVRALMLLHPQNPLGFVYSAGQLRRVMEICAQHEVHIIVDEIYAFSVHSKETKFNSVLGLESLPDPQRTHVIWSFSKDFAVPGFRLAVIYSWNSLVLSCLDTLSSYHTNAQLIQHAAATIINDEEWCDGFYIPTNMERLAKAYHKTRQHLEAMGIVVFEATAGLYIWANMQAFLQPCTEETEMALFTALVNGGVCILPGQKLYCSNPGWYRIVFALTDDELDTALARMKVVLSQWKSKPAVVVN